MNAAPLEDHFRERGGRPSAFSAHRSDAEQVQLIDLISVLRAHPAGLRRWSVMRAIRNRRGSSGEEIALKFEHDVERTFRRFCTDDSMSNGIKGGCSADETLFYRPKDKAGEVWAVHAARADAWLRAGAGSGFRDAC